MEITFSSSFKKSFRKKIKNNASLEKIFWDRVGIFIKNCFDNRLKTHKLTGKLKGLWSFSIDYDLRVIFFINDQGNAVFTDIGLHQEVY